MYQEVEIWQDFLSVFLVFQVSWISASWLAHLDSWWLYLHGRYALPIHIQRTKVIYIRFALILQIYQGEAYVFVVWMIFESGCGIQMSQATPTKFSMLFKHTYGKNFWKFGGHSYTYVWTPISLIKKGHGQRKNLSYGHQIFRKVCHNYA